MAKRDKNHPQNTNDRRKANNIIRRLLQEYDIEIAEVIEDVLKDGAILTVKVQIALIDAHVY